MRVILKQAVTAASLAVAIGLQPLALQAQDGKRAPSKTGETRTGPSVAEAYAHATVPGQQVGAMYMTLRSSHEAALSGAETEVARQVQVHQMHKHDGVMRMRRAHMVDIPAGGEVRLAPGGMHLMLIGLKKPLQAGEQIPMKLTFVAPGKERTVLTINVPVRPLGQ